MGIRYLNCDAGLDVLVDTKTYMCTAYATDASGNLPTLLAQESYRTASGARQAKMDLKAICSQAGNEPACP